MRTLDHLKEVFNSVGWFIPPYVTLGFLGKLAVKIEDCNHKFDQIELESYISAIYSSDYLAAMVTERYPVTPYISDYQEIISESVEAHFLGLDHVAVAGLMPVIEGAGRKLAKHRKVSAKHVKDVFIALANDCKRRAINDNIGHPGEIVSMMDSFIEFTSENLYVNSAKYPSLGDNTNRHGILHGDYADEDYGTPINFYKSIAAVDFLCMVSAFDAAVSWLAPDKTPRSISLGRYYRICLSISKKKVERDFYL